MAQVFTGLTIPNNSSLHSTLVLFEQCRLYLESLVQRLGPRIARPMMTAGRDTRGGRDYFFEQIELAIRGRPGRSFLGFFHYGETTQTPGSFFEVWESEGDSEPCFQRSLNELAQIMDEAWANGRLSDRLDEEAGYIRDALDL